MKVVIKNFFRNNISNLTIKSVRHFLPEAEIFVINQFKYSPDEYLSLPKLDVDSDKILYGKTKYFDMGPSVGNKLNNLFFSEPYNQIHEIFKDCNEKVLMLCEDHFFTKGQTLKELNEVDFDIAYAKWDGGANGSILCVVPTKVIFPIEEKRDSVEHVLYDFITRVHKDRRYCLSTRDGIDYKGDGFYSNSFQEIEAALKEVGIA